MSNVLIQFPKEKFVDDRGEVSKPWRQWLLNPQVITINLAQAVGITSGGTGLAALPGIGQLLIGNGGAYVLNTLTAGSGITVSNTPGSITVSNTGVIALTAGAGIGVSGNTGNVTVSNTGVTALAGTANQVSVSATVGSITVSLPQSIATSSTPTFSGVSVGTINGNTVTTGSFTVTLTGFTATVTGTAVYSLANNVATLFIPILTGTSNATTMTATGIPAAITPATNHNGFGVCVEDNGAASASPGRADALSNNTIAFFQNFATGPFTNTGVKGLPLGATLTYNLN